MTHNVKQTVPLPKGRGARERLNVFLRSVTQLPLLLELRVSPEGVQVTRAIEDAEGEVIPASLLEQLRGDEELRPEIADLLAKVPLSSYHPTNACLDLSSLSFAQWQLQQERLRPSALVFAPGEPARLFAEVREYTPDHHGPDVLLGVSLFQHADLEPGRCVLFGSLTGLMIDSTHGIVLYYDTVTEPTEET